MTSTIGPDHAEAHTWTETGRTGNGWDHCQADREGKLGLGPGSGALENGTRGTGAGTGEIMVVAQTRSTGTYVGMVTDLWYVAFRDWVAGDSRAGCFVAWEPFMI